jgi:hypothetical protein
MHAPKRHNQRLGFDKAREIRRLRSEKRVSARELAECYGVALSTIFQLLRGEIWREPTASPKRTPRGPISQEKTAEIRRLADNNPGLSLERIGFLTGVSGTTVRNVLKAR